MMEIQKIDLDELGLASNFRIARRIFNRSKVPKKGNEEIVGNYRIGTCFLTKGRILDMDHMEKFMKPSILSVKQR